MNRTRFLDTNILLRLIKFDHPDHSSRTLGLFHQLADEEFEGLISMTVVFEIVFVLERTGHRDDRSFIADAIEIVCRAPGVRLLGDELNTLRTTISLYRAHPKLSFPDCYHAALALAHCDGEIYTFDKDFGHVPGIARLEP